MRRDWRFYSKEKLVVELNRVDWSVDATNVQGIWNDFETKLIHVVDNLVPIVEFILVKDLIKLLN